MPAALPVMNSRCEKPEAHAYQELTGYSLLHVNVQRKGTPERTRRPARVALPKQVEEDGKSECLPVMGGIGDETIALTRKRADFHLVTLREKGLCNR